MRDYSLLLSTYKIMVLTLFKMLGFGTTIIEQNRCLTSYAFTLLLPKHLENRLSPLGLSSSLGVGALRLASSRMKYELDIPSVFVP